MKHNKKFYVVVYDIHKDKNRDRISKLLEKYGIRVNYSVFECLFTEKQLTTVQEKALKLIDKHRDSIIYYPICMNCYVGICYQPKQLHTVFTVDVV